MISVAPLPMRKTSPTSQRFGAMIPATVVIATPGIVSGTIGYAYSPNSSGQTQDSHAFQAPPCLSHSTPPQASQSKALGSSFTLKPEKEPPTMAQRALHLGAGAAMMGGVVALRRKIPVDHLQIHAPLLSPDWKEWAKVGLGIAGVSQVNQALGWKPPLWLQSMVNVMVVGPLVAGVSKKNIIQGAVLAPVVAAMAQTTQYLSGKSEKPLQEIFHIPPVLTHAIFSAGMMLAGLRVFPWVNNAIPQAAESGAAARTGMMTTCANGCCASLVCVNDVAQLGTSLVHSIRHPRSDKEKK